MRNTSCYAALPSEVGDVVSNAARLAAVGQAHAAAAAAMPDFDRLVRVAALALRADRAVVSLVDAERQWFVARSGTDLDGSRVEDSFCAHALVAPDELLVVPDAAEDPRFANSSFLLGDQPIRFYAGMPLRVGDGQPVGTLCVFDSAPRPAGLDARETTMLRDLAALAADAFASARAVDHAEIVRDELRHRMGNIYAQIGSLVSLMGRTIGSKDVLVERLQSRIAAMATTQSMLLDHAGGGATLAQLVDRALQPYRTGPDADRITCDGDAALPVTTRGAFALTLMLGELASNALRHGALREAGGAVTFGWRLEGERIRLEWRESGVPMPVGAADTARRTGFGTAILSRIVPAELAGQAQWDFAPDGICYRIDADTRRLCGSAEAG